MRILHILVCIALTLLITACAAPIAPQEQATPEPEPAPIDPCATVRCAAGTTCIDGDCVCNEGTKRCGENCIASDACCTNDDCAEGNLCSDGECAPIPRCAFGEAYNASSGTCACGESFKWCGEQSKCIAYDSCCDIFDCNPTGGIDRRCLPSEIGVQVCLEEGGIKHCREARTGMRNGFTLKSGDYDVFVDKVYADNQFDARLVLRGKETPLANLTVGQRLIFNGVSITPNSIGSIGGSCKNKDTFR